MTSKFLNPQSINFDTGTAPPSTHVLPAKMQLVVKLLRRLQHGALRVELPNGHPMAFGDGSRPICLNLHNWEIATAVLRSGDIGFAETYIDGSWDTDNLPGLIELLIRNRDAAESLIYGTWWGSLMYRIKHLFNRNTRSGSKKNIHAHYDIGNNFYQRWLDPSMTYSSALFIDGNTDDLQEAQTAKYRRILHELRVQPGAKVLEIGCGWGGFAELAVSESDTRVTGLTLSSEQLEFARRRLVLAGADDKVDLRLQDYRDVNGSFDAIASIEMFEAVGESFWPSYFECVARNLKSGGRACIQTIVIADELFERYRTGTDFIQQYIFPGGMLPSPSVFRAQAEKHGLRVANELAFGLDYAHTLANWRSAFNAQLPEIGEQGFDTRFLRTWEFYLAYCEAAFRARNTDVMQFTLEKM